MATQAAVPETRAITTAEQTAAPECNLLLDGLKELYAAKAAFVSALILLALLIAAILANQIARHEPSAMSLPNRMLNPVRLDGSNPAFFSGTDGLGRDILSRLIHASQMTLIVAVAAVLFGGIVGVTLGLLSGYYGGWLDSIIMRLTDLQLAFPSLLPGLIVIPVVAAGPAAMAIIYVILNLIADLSYALLDPRIRHG